MNTNTEATRESNFQEWMRGDEDDLVLAVDRIVEEVGRGVSVEVVDTMRNDTAAFVLARMNNWMDRHPDRGVKRLRVHIHVEID